MGYGATGRSVLNNDVLGLYFGNNVGTTSPDDVTVNKSCHLTENTVRNNAMAHSTPALPFPTSKNN